MFENFFTWLITGKGIERKTISSIIPLSDIEFKNRQEDFFKTKQTMKETIKVSLHPSAFNSENIIEFKGEQSKNFEFRPQNWWQFIGQEEAKNRAKTIIAKHKLGMKAHILVDGIKGHGKTTFVELIAKELNAHLIKRIGKQVDEEELKNLINEINSSSNVNVILFIDEFDTMDWKIIKILNPILESFEIAGKKIKPFIFAGATINKYMLIKNVPDTLDRIPAHIKFTRYNYLEIYQILKQYKEQLFTKINIKEQDYLKIANNCKFNPRTAIALLEELIVEHKIENVFRNWKIIKEGLTDIDLKILTILKNSKRPLGSNALAMKIGIAEQDYLRSYEPYLVEYDYINRIPSRILGEKGKQLIEEINV